MGERLYLAVKDAEIQISIVTFQRLSTRKFLLSLGKIFAHGFIMNSYTHEVSNKSFTLLFQGRRKV